MTKFKVDELKLKLSEMLPTFEKHGLLREGFNFWNTGAVAESDLACYHTWYLRPKAETYIIAEYSHDLTMDNQTVRFIVKSWDSGNKTTDEAKLFKVDDVLDTDVKFSEELVVGIKNMIPRTLV